MKAGEYSAALTQLDSLPVVGQDDIDIDFDTVTTRAINLESNGETWANLDSIGVNRLKTIVADSLPSSFMARAALEIAKGFNYPPYRVLVSGGDIESDKAKAPKPNKNNVANNSEQISIYPNPTKDQFTVSFNGFNQTANISIEIYDNLGTLKYFTTYNSVSNGSIYYISTDNLSNGVYLCRIIKNGQPDLEEKLAVIKE